MTTIEKLEQKAKALLLDMEKNPDPRSVELREIEIAIKVLRRETPKGEDAASMTLDFAVRPKKIFLRTLEKSLFPARPGSAKEFIAAFLREHGPTDKTALLEAFHREGREIKPVTLSSALSKSGGMFLSNGSGVWRLAEPPVAKPA
jgi:hypothetical protein